MRKPKIGLLGLMAGSYEPIFPGIVARQEAFARELAVSFSSVADVDFPSAALDRADIEQKMRYFNQSDCDGVLIVLLTYSQGVWRCRITACRSRWPWCSRTAASVWTSANWI